MKKIFILAFLVTSIFAEKLIIDAKKFEAYDEKGLSVFTGNVDMKRDKDELQSDRLEVYLSKKTENKKREALKYIALGNVSFKIKTADKLYEGKGDKVVYDPKKLIYTITGDGFIKELTEDKKLFGDKIYVNQATGEAKVSGSDDKPVRFIIDLANSNDSDETKEENK